MKKTEVERCERCDRPATAEVWCATHYRQWLSEWACECGEVNGGGINRFTKRCGFCGKANEEGGK
jgi:hypothetical protein